MKIEFPFLGNKAGYHKLFVAETAIIRVKTLLGGTSSLRNHIIQISERDAIAKSIK
ncbi:hypothetical protein [Candidatus Enterovibrio altilux]|uniref:Mobile element protein n=1 Tax=Candidatus Enterovibrio altilux TaxID=1927128 RepID=A0A291B762_9GAMM|nr:hypothetical protein [Candidatus Enterovibrio luxaltus]ATF08841.1 hypothetical protein BTN50_0304 [Candidatus Enterovibrio luxaltus]